VSASASSIPVVPVVGQTVPGVGRYRYIAMLAEGGMADVYLAVTQSAGFEKLVVIKQLRDILAQDPSFVAMFMDEARLAARLNHPNVVQTLEVGSEPAHSLHFMAMEFLEGVPYVRLARLKERLPPPLAFHLRILIDVLRGLHYAHELHDFDGKPLNVVHRDVSPHNVMLTFAGGVKVLDFGIAKAALAAEQRPEDFKGKLEYMAPEQAALQDVDRRADIFSVGVMLFEALARRRLYRKGDDKLQQLLDGDLPDVLDVAPSTPRRLAEICRRAMAHDRDARYATADAMADDLEEWLESTTQHVTARDVGSYVAEKFSSTRAKISAAIEAQLAIIRAMSESAPDTIPLSRLPITTTTDLPATDFSDPPPPVAAEPGRMPPPPLLPGGLDAGKSSSSWAGPDAAVITVAPRSPPPSDSSRSRTAALLAVAALLGVAVLGGVVAIASKGRHVAPASDESAAAPASALAPPTAAPAAEEATIDLTIKASPPEAKIFIDGKPLPSNPVKETRPRDGAMHVLRAEAPGHDPREESIAFDKSIFVTIELRPSPAAFEVPSKPPPPRTGKSPRPAPRAPRPHAPTGKALDLENPYQ
jgi:serine/threonine-protein kinase